MITTVSVQAAFECQIIPNWTTIVSAQVTFEPQILQNLTATVSAQVTNSIKFDRNCDCSGDV